MLTKLETWDEGLIEKFVDDVPVDGRGAPVHTTVDGETIGKFERRKRLRKEDSDYGRFKRFETSVGDANGSDMELEDLA